MSTFKSTTQPMKLLSIVLLLLIAFPSYSQSIKDKSFTYRNGLQEANYNGKNGRSGANGSLRFAIKLFHMARRGGHGKPGKSAPNLLVRVSAIPSGDSSILIVSITKEGGKKTAQYYVNPKYGKLIISANGGDGGSGGDGEDGDTPGEKRPYGGIGGDGGNGADGGNGGTIKVAFDSAAIRYVDCNCIFYNNFGGQAGEGGEGGKGTTNLSADGSPGIDGGRGISGPRVFIEGPDKKIIQIH